jgi:hypothetical protein
VLSHLCHYVIHSSDAFSGDFGPRIRIAGVLDDPTMRWPFMNPKPKACFRGSQ